MSELITESSKAYLSYSAGRGRAETIRWMLTACNIEFENKTLKTRQDFLDLIDQGKLMFNQVPLLEIDDINITQSTAIVNYLARKGNLTGKNLIEETKCQQIYNVIMDIYSPCLGYPFRNIYGTDINANITKFVEKQGKILEKLLRENGGVFFVGNQLTFADIVVAECFTGYLELMSTSLDELPVLKAFQERIIQLPNFKAYLEGPNRYPLGDNVYVANVNTVLGR